MNSFHVFLDTHVKINILLRSIEVFISNLTYSFAFFH